MIKKSNSSEFDSMYEKYLNSADKIVFIDEFVFYKIIFKIKNPNKDNSILITVPRGALRDGKDYYDENGFLLVLNRVNTSAFYDDMLPRCHDTVMLSVDNVFSVDQIGEFVGRKTNKESWLLDSEIDKIIKVYSKHPNDTIHKLLKNIAKHGIKEADPTVKEKTMADFETERKFKIMNACCAIDNLCFEPNKSCPLCSGKNISHNVFDYYCKNPANYFRKEKRNYVWCHWEPKMFKYYCLNCGSVFENAQSAKTIFAYGAGAYFGGYYECEIIEYDRFMLFKNRLSNGLVGNEYVFEFPKSGIAELKSTIKPILKWEKEYTPNMDVDDGYGWGIKFDYDGLDVESQGYHITPTNYSTVIGRVKKAIDNLCRKYGN